MGSCQTGRERLVVWQTMMINGEGLVGGTVGSVVARGANGLTARASRLTEKFNKIPPRTEESAEPPQQDTMMELLPLNLTALLLSYIYRYAFTRGIPIIISRRRSDRKEQEKKPAIYTGTV